MSNVGPFSLDLSTLSLTPLLPVCQAAAVSYLHTGSQGLSVAACSSHGVPGSRVLLGLKQRSGGDGELLEREAIANRAKSPEPQNLDDRNTNPLPWKKRAAQPP